MSKSSEPSLRYITDFEGNYDKEEAKDLPFYALDLIRKVQTVETSDSCGWKSYVVENAGRYCITLESFIFTNAQAEDVRIPQEYLNDRVREDMERIRDGFSRYKAEVSLSFDEGKNPTITILLPEVRTRGLLLMLASEAQKYTHYDIQRIINRYVSEIEV